MFSEGKITLDKDTSITQPKNTTKSSDQSKAAGFEDLDGDGNAGHGDDT